jgi:RimJ/RimL family protein N-acetyltransferase
MRVDPWPMSGLSIRSPRLTLRFASERDMSALAADLPADVETDPSLPQHTGLAAVQARSVQELQQYWRNLGNWTAQAWKAPFAVVRAGRLVGVQTLEGVDFARRRVVETASWLLVSERGQGVGREMRAAVLHLAFEGLGARAATSTAWHDNAASIAVSRSLGYVDNGYDLHVRNNRSDRMMRMILTAAAWQQRVRPAFEVSGLNSCLPFFGVG